MLRKLGQINVRFGLYQKTNEKSNFRWRCHWRTSLSRRHGTRFRDATAFRFRRLIVARVGVAQERILFVVTSSSIRRDVTFFVVRSICDVILAGRTLVVVFNVVNVARRWRFSTFGTSATISERRRTTEKAFLGRLNLGWRRHRLSLKSQKWFFNDVTLFSDYIGMSMVPVYIRGPVYFTNIFWAATSYKSVSWSISLIIVWHCNVWQNNVWKKAARKMLVKLTSGAHTLFRWANQLK